MREKEWFESLFDGRIHISEEARLRASEDREFAERLKRDIENCKTDRDRAKENT